MSWLFTSSNALFELLLARRHVESEANSFLLVECDEDFAHLLPRAVVDSIQELLDDSSLHRRGISAAERFRAHLSDRVLQPHFFQRARLAPKTMELVVREHVTQSSFLLFFYSSLHLCHLRVVLPLEVGAFRFEIRVVFTTRACATALSYYLRSSSSASFVIKPFSCISLASLYSV